MKKYKNILVLVIVYISTLLFIACNGSLNKGNSSNSNNSSGSSSTQQEQHKEVEISGTYSGTDNVGMKSTIILQNGGALIIKASVGDGSLDYGNWTGTADKLSLYHKDAFGNDELIGNAKVSEAGLSIIGGKFYARN
jgi:hypothetical protein